MLSEFTFLFKDCLSLSVISFLHCCCHFTSILPPFFFLLCLFCPFFLLALPPSSYPCFVSFIIPLFCLLLPTLALLPSSSASPPSFLRPPPTSFGPPPSSLGPPPPSLALPPHSSKYCGSLGQLLTYSCPPKDSKEDRQEDPKGGGT